MEQEREQERQTYRLCRLGFAILSFALVIACLSTLLTLLALLGGRPLVPLLQNSPLWKWVDAPIVWGSLVGTYLLWGRWDNPSWQRRSGLLVVMGVVDVVLWPPGARRLPWASGPRRRSGTSGVRNHLGQAAPALGRVRPDGEPLVRGAGPPRGSPRPPTPGKRHEVAGRDRGGGLDALLLREHRLARGLAPGRVGPTLQERCYSTSARGWSGPSR